MLFPHRHRAQTNGTFPLARSGHLHYKILLMLEYHIYEMPFPADSIYQPMNPSSGSSLKLIFFKIKCYFCLILFGCSSLPIFLVWNAPLLQHFIRTKVGHFIRYQSWRMQMRRHGNNEEGKGAAQKGFETRGCRYFMWSMMTKLKHVQQAASHFQVHFVWQVWDGQLSPSFKSIRLKVFGG